MNELELHAYGKIAQTLAERAFNTASESTQFSSAFPEVPGPIYRHYGNSTFEDLASALWRLGILRSLEPEFAWARCFAFDCELTEAEMLLSATGRMARTYVNCSKCSSISSTNMARSITIFRARYMFRLDEMAV